jgi:general secretion pathway protein M
MREWLDNLSPREQQALILGGVVVGLLLFYAIVWSPLLRSNASLVAEVAEENRELEWMRGAAVEARTLGAVDSAPESPDSRTLIARVTAELRREGLVASQVRPEGENRLRLTLGGASFTRLMQTLSRLEGQYSVRVREAVVEPGGVPGIVNARLLLERVGG